MYEQIASVSPRDSIEKDIKRVEELVERYHHRLDFNQPIGKIENYLVGNHKDPYTPYFCGGAKDQYKLLAQTSITNWLPLITDTYTKSLIVQNISCKNTELTKTLWYIWQMNNLHANQSLVHRAAINYGYGYVLVLPSSVGYPLIKAYSPVQLYARYSLGDDTYPKIAIIYKGENDDNEKIYQVIDEKYSTDYISTNQGFKKINKPDKHNLGFVPIIKFKECQSTTDTLGLIAPLIPIQDRINDIVFSVSVAIQFASFRQKYAVGADYACKTHLVYDKEGDCKEQKCEPVSPFSLAPDTFLLSSSPETKFGEFSQTALKDHHEAYIYAVKSLASIAQIPAHLLLGDISNISVEALAAAESPMQKKIGEYEILFASSWTQVLTLAATIQGFQVNEPLSISWKNSEVRSLSQIADALGKIATMLEVPKTELWSMIPGISEEQIQKWRIAKEKEDSIKSLDNLLIDKDNQDNDT